MISFRSKILASHHERAGHRTRATQPRGDARECGPGDESEIGARARPCYRPMPPVLLIVGRVQVVPVKLGISALPWRASSARFGPMLARRASCWSLNQACIARFVSLASRATSTVRFLPAGPRSRTVR
jgi:hypothetical protein